MECPCGTEQEFSDCCEPYIQGKQKAETAERLLRSRYSAFTQMEMDYVLNTHDPKTRHEADMEANKNWAESVDWMGLDVVGITGGGKKDQEAYIEFKAYYEDDEGEQEHHELSEFRKYNGKWYFVKAQHPHSETYVREEPKIGRNDPCVCGSGKKYKKCCGAN